MESRTNYPVWFYRFSGALATKFVGRKDDIKVINNILNDSSAGPRIIYFCGKGGLGKTRFLQETLGLAMEASGSMVVAKKLVDFYHYRNHSTTELMAAILDVFGDAGHLGIEINAIRKELNNLSLKRAMVDVHGFNDQMQKAIETFDTKMREISSRKRIVLAFDTLERIIYQDDDHINSETIRAQSWDWLVENFPRWGNITLALAGRDSSTPLFEQIRAVPGVRSEKIVVKPFTTEDKIEYFQAAEEVARKAGAVKVQDIIQDLQVKGLIEKYAELDDRPIVFSLLLHLLCLGPVPINESMQESSNLEALVINRLVNTRHLGDTIVALGRLPKGANALLLSRILGESETEAQKRIDEVNGLSFIKTRESDDRVFLHDEMYFMLDRHVYDFPADELAKQKNGQEIDEYYIQKIEEHRVKFNAPFLEIEQNPDKVELTLQEKRGVVRSLFERQTHMAESLFYRLRNDPCRGIRFYYRYMREALRSADPYFSLQLEAELLNYLALIEANRGSIDQEEIQSELVRGMVNLFPIVRSVSISDYQKALEDSLTLEQVFPDLFSTGNCYGLHANLLIWRGDCEYHLEQKSEAKTFINEAISEIKGLLAAWESENGETSEEILKKIPRLWFLTASLAMANHILGQLLKVQGSLSEAVDHYGEAIRLWRDVRVHIELATTENDLSDVISNRGASERPKFWAGDALELRWQIAPITQISSSLNTSGIIAMRQGRYSEAIAYSESALRLARAVEGEEGYIAGLALIALAEENRRMATYSTYPFSNKKREYFLQFALKYAIEGQRVFSIRSEKVHLAEALIEVGCANRDLLRIYVKEENSGQKCLECAEDGREALEKAAQVAESVENGYRKIDALVNLAWLEFIVGDNNLYRESIHRAKKLLKPYTFATSKLLNMPQRAQIEPLIWTQLAKLTILLGWEEMRKFDYLIKQEDPGWYSPLRAAAALFTEGFEYSVRYSRDYPGLHQAANQLLNRLKQLNRQVRQVFVESILRCEEKLGPYPVGEHSYLYNEIDHNFLKP